MIQNWDSLLTKSSSVAGGAVVGTVCEYLEVLTPLNLVCEHGGTFMKIKHETSGLGPMKQYRSCQRESQVLPRQEGASLIGLARC